MKSEGIWEETVVVIWEQHVIFRSLSSILGKINKEYTISDFNKGPKFSARLTLEIPWVQLETTSKTFKVK